jgi:serine/threonine protein kinase
MPLQSGKKLGPYVVGSLLGAGGMGEVYAATDSRLNRKVAIKVLPEQLASDAQRRERFEREAKAISSLNHPRGARAWSLPYRTKPPRILPMDHTQRYYCAGRARIVASSSCERNGNHHEQH